MQLELLHGSENIIKKPLFGFGNPKNDFGLGFYCTLDQNLAREWAVSPNKDGYVNSYNLATDNLATLDLLSGNYTILHWLALLINHRTFDIQSDFGKEAVNYINENFYIDLSEYDIIKGYRADDSYFSFAQDFLNNIISLKTLSEAMVLGKLGIQYVLRSKKSFSCIKYIESTKVESRVWHAKKQIRDEKARADYKKIRSRPYKKGEIYMMQIIENNLGANDVRIR